MYAILLSTENSGSIFGYSNNLLDFSIHFCDFQWQVNHRVKPITKSIGLSESVRKFLNGKNFVSFWMTLGSFRLMHRPQHDITLPSFRYLSHDRLFAIILWRTPLFMKHIYWQQLACSYHGSAWQLLQEALIDERRGAGSDCRMLLLLLFFLLRFRLYPRLFLIKWITRAFVSRETKESRVFLPQFALSPRTARDRSSAFPLSGAC